MHAISEIDWSNYGSYYPNYPIDKLSTLKNSGFATVVIPNNKTQFIDLVLFCKSRDIPFFILGNGSNTLIGKYDGIIIVTKKMNNISVNGDEVYVECGVTNKMFINFCMKNNLSGSEFLVGIPGTIGGGLFMNVGAFGNSISDIVTEVEVIFNGKSSFKTYEGHYRDSNAKRGGWIILGARIKLRKSENIGDLLKQNYIKKRNSQPLLENSLGCVFKNTSIVSAGELISNQKSMYDAGEIAVSNIHANFVINKNKCRAFDYFMCIKKIKYDLDLEFEINFIGEFYD